MVRPAKLPKPNPMAPSRRLTGSAWEAALARLCDPHTIRAVVGVESRITVGTTSRRVVCTLGLPRHATPLDRIVRVPGLLSFCEPKDPWVHLQTEPRRAVGNVYKSLYLDYIRACEYEVPGVGTHPFDIAHAYGFSIDYAATYVSETMGRHRSDVIELVDWIATRMLKPRDRYAMAHHQRQTLLLGKITPHGAATTYAKWLDEPYIGVGTPTIVMHQSGLIEVDPYID